MHIVTSRGGGRGLCGAPDYYVPDYPLNPHGDHLGAYRRGVSKIDHHYYFRISATLDSPLVFGSESPSQHFGGTSPECDTLRRADFLLGEMATTTILPDSSVDRGARVPARSVYRGSTSPLDGMPD